LQPLFKQIKNEADGRIFSNVIEDYHSLKESLYKALLALKDQDIQINV
jgi:hypothetical protein